MGRNPKKVRWNVNRKRALGARFLRMAGVQDVAEAKALWEDPSTPMGKRRVAARALGLLGTHGPKWRVAGVEEESPLDRTREHATREFERRRHAEREAHEREDAGARMIQLGAKSIADAIRILENKSESEERRESAAAALRGLKCRTAVRTLIEALAEGDQKLSWMCMSALVYIRSRTGARRLIEIARGNYPRLAKREAVYTLWWLTELRAEPLFIRLSAALKTEEDYTRSIATEALGNTWWRPRTQIAIAARLFDPSELVRFSALCAVREVNDRTLICLRQALIAKLDDPAALDEHRVIAKTAAELLGGG